MSVNGQDPRSNVYLLDGTLQNDFTNGPAGSAAGTALGTGNGREFRVESNAYSAEFGRNSGGQINALTKSGANTLDGSRLRIPSQRRARRAQLLRRRRASRISIATSSAEPSAARSPGTAAFFFGYEALIERLGKTSNGRPGRQRAQRASCRSGSAGQSGGQPYLD